VSPSPYGKELFRKKANEGTGISGRIKRKKRRGGRKARGGGIKSCVPHGPRTEKKGVEKKRKRGWGRSKSGFEGVPSLKKETKNGGVQVTAPKGKAKVNP